MKNLLKNNKGITLIALVVTIIILTILAGVSINLIIGDNGIITIAKRAKENIEITKIEEETELNELYTQLEAKNIEINKANTPKLLKGMTPIKFTMPTEEKMGEVVETTKRDSDWYNYGITYNTKRWANAKTEDGSMWVWIPRFAYKITYTDNTDKSKGGIVKVVFLKGTSDNYYDENGNIQTAQRQTSENQTIDTTADFTVHPAFTNESSINYANGGWDKELTGIWVAKFEAGYASGNNNTEVKASSVNYSQDTSGVKAIERGADDQKDGAMDARNWLDGVYGSTKTAIKYPVFQGTTYVMNYINHNDSYNIAKVLNENGNIYGLSASDSDSHLMKNSEWGAVAYLSKSIYGQNDEEIKVNNANLNSGNRKRTSTAGKSGVDSVYGVTGCTNNTTDTEDVLTTINKINNISKNIANADGIYVWNQKNGQNASTTGTIYGIYDLSGCMWEKTSSYIANNNLSLKTYGESIAYNESALKLVSTKYTTIYPNNESGQTNISTASQLNFTSNTRIYGDAIRETTGSNAATSNSGWNLDSSNFIALGNMLLLRGGSLWNGSRSGAFAFSRDSGSSIFAYGFRAVLVNI